MVQVHIELLLTATMRVEARGCVLEKFLEHAGATHVPVGIGARGEDAQGQRKKGYEAGFPWAEGFVQREGS